MQEPVSSSMHIFCMDLRVGMGDAMLLYATRVHLGPSDKDSLKWGSIVVMTCDSNDGACVFARAMFDL